MFSASFVISLGLPESTGLVASMTVTVNVSWASGLPGDQSFAVYVTVVVPNGKVKPEAGYTLLPSTLLYQLQ